MNILAAARLLLVCSLFLPLVSYEATRYPLELESARSVSTLLIITGTTCGEINYYMLGGYYDQDTTLYLWNEEDCEKEPFYINAGYWWADKVCSGDECVIVSVQ